MNGSDFNNLAKEVLLSLIQGNGQMTPEVSHLVAETAVTITDAFTRALNRHPVEVAQATDLAQDEITLLRNGKIIDAIKRVRLRLGINLKDAKALVDRERGKLNL